MAGKNPPVDEDEALWSTGTEDDELWTQGTDEAPSEPPAQDWGDATRTGSSVVQPAPGPESIAPEPFGPENIEVDGPEALAMAYLSGFGKQGADEATGATAAAMYGGDGTTGDVYRMTRDRMRDRMAAAQAQHPVKTFLAGMAGDVSSDYLLKLMGVPVASQEYQTAMGGVSGFLGSDADLTRPDAQQLTQAATDTGKGLALGYTAPIVGRWLGKGVGKGAQWVGDSRPAQLASEAWENSSFRQWLQDRARERALKAAGYIQKDLPQEPAKRARLLERGERLLESPGLITPGSTTETIADRLQPLKERAGAAVGGSLAKVDESLPDIAGGAAHSFVPSNPYTLFKEQTPFDPYAFADRAEKEIVEKYSANPVLHNQVRTIQGLLGRFRATADKFVAEGKPFPLALANEIKGDLQDAIFNGRGDVAKNKELANALQRVLNEEIEGRVEALAGEGERAAFQLAKQQYGDYADALKKATQGANREVGNNLLGLGDRATAEVAAAAGGGIPGAAAAAFVSKMFRGRGDSTAARGLDWASRQDWLDDLARTNPEALGKWGQYLGAAASRSADALSQAKYELGQTDSEYQEERRRQGGQNP